MIFWIILFVLVEWYSLGVALLAKNHNDKRWALNFIPFASFFYVGKYLKEFRIFTVPVTKWGKFVIELFVVILAFYLFNAWGQKLPNEYQVNAVYLISRIPIWACIGIVWAGVVFSSLRILFKHYANFRMDWLVILLILPIPFLFKFLCKEEKDIYKVEKKD